jgi:5-methylcytosine-specific restriction endonuclease McrA
VTQYKTCSKCKQTKALDDFHNSKSGKQGKKPSCKVCNTAAAIAYAKDNKAKTYARIYAWQKANPEKAKAYRSKSREKRKEIDRQYRKNYYLANKEAKRVYYIQYAQANREKVSAKGQRWRKANPDKLRLYSSERRSRTRLASVFVISDREIAQLLRQPCFYCGGLGGTLDHIIPLSKGGLHGIGNLVGACERCNKSKSNKFITEWKKVRGW